MTVKVTVLKDGTIERDADGNILDASSSVTLVRTPEANVIVDTAMPHDANEILEGLQSHGLDTEDVDIIVNTHCHHDHTGCNSLFGRAQVVVHRREGVPRCAPERGRRVDMDTQLLPGVRVVMTPGHTRGSISVAADTPEGTWVMAGDALPTADNYIAWVPPGVNYDLEVALTSMKHIVDMAWMIVPGHGAPFLKEGELPQSVMELFY
jgi:glyoxylase-like metal-dependent hydrolase (beta-lactamase superfamily II)